MQCKKCKTNSSGNFCPNCGAPLQAEQAGPYAAYMHYYPDKLAAISALRRDTGMGFSDAVRAINSLFGITDDEIILAADAEHEKQLRAQEETREQLKAAGKKAAKVAGIAAAAGIYGFFSVIFKLMKKYK